MPEGEPADEATVDAVLETVWQLGACINAGDFFGRYAALFTEEYFQREFERFGPIPEEERPPSPQRPSHCRQVPGEFTGHRRRAGAP